MTRTPNAAFAERVPFAVQNVTQSIPVPGFEDSFQIAPILAPREDGKFYTGTLSYTTNEIDLDHKSSSLNDWRGLDSGPVIR
jgi:hypothetical protein